MHVGLGPSEIKERDHSLFIMSWGWLGNIQPPYIKENKPMLENDPSILVLLL